jgi:hypothetical protein
MRQHTSADVGIRQHTCLSSVNQTRLSRERTLSMPPLFQHQRVAAYLSAAYVSMRQHTSAYVSRAHAQRASAFLTLARGNVP